MLSIVAMIVVAPILFAGKGGDVSSNGKASGATKKH